MANLNDIEARKQAAKAESENAFNEWLNADNTRVLLSLVPPSADHPEALQTLLKNAFHAGEGTATMSIFKSIMTAEPRPGDFNRNGL